MATFKFEGVDDLIAQYEKLAKNTDQMIGSAVYNGAAVVMRAVESAVDNNKTTR